MLKRWLLDQIILYGSWARGDATEKSDIDLLIVLGEEIIPGKEIDRMIEIIIEINLKHKALISVYPVSEKDYSTVNSPLLINVRREGVPAMKEVESLIKKAMKYLKSARILLEDGDCESSVSRAYYAKHKF